MREAETGFIEPEQEPTSEELESFLGKKNHELWVSLSEWIAKSYPDVFSPEWIRGGKKSGWYLRYKKNKSFCQFIPKKNRFVILITFGAKERDKVEGARSGLSSQTREAYDNATTFHDGKWLYLPVLSNSTVIDVQKLLSTKRRIKNNALT